MITFSEAIKLKDGLLHNLAYHQQRVDRTLHNFYRTKIDLSVISRMIPLYAEKGLYKCRVLYTDRIEKIEFIPYTFRQLKRIGVMVDDEINYSYKYANRSNIDRLLQQSGCDDILIIKNGLVTDSSSANLVFRSSEGLFTPKDYLLPGTKRQFLLDTKRIEEKRIREEEIKNFDEVYFINAMIDLEDDISIKCHTLTY